MRQSAPPLKAGDLVGVVAASSAYDDLQPLAAGLELLRSWGLQANDQSIPERRWGYLAGTDQERIADLQCQPSPALLACARGGWGAARLLEHPIQWNPGWLLGFSDVTALLLARQSGGLDGGIHGPHHGVETDKPEHHLLEPDAIAETYYQLHSQHRSAWAAEIDVRPWVESF